MFRVAGLAGQVIIPQFIHEPGAALFGNLLHYRAGKDLGAENSRHAGSPHLVNQRRHFPGRGFGKIRGLHRPNQLQPVAGAEVGKGVVIGQKFAIFRRDGGHGGGDSTIQIVNAALQPGVVFAVIGGVDRVEGRKFVPDDFGVFQGQMGGGPEMGIGLAGGFGKGKVKDPFRRSDGPVAQSQDNRAGFLIGPGQGNGRLLEKEAVGDEQVGGGQGRRQGGGRLKSMGIGALGNQAGQDNAVAADIFHQTGDGGYGAGYLQAGIRGSRRLGRGVFRRRVGAGGRGASQQQRDSQQQRQQRHRKPPRGHCSNPVRRHWPAPRPPRRYH